MRKKQQIHSTSHLSSSRPLHSPHKKPASSKPSSLSDLQHRRQLVLQALSDEELLEAEREEMLSVVTSVKDRQRLEAIFEQERLQASHRLLAMSQTDVSPKGKSVGKSKRN